MAIADAQKAFSSAQELISGGMSVRQAAKRVGVSRDWLRRRIKGDVAINAKNGPSPVLKPDEEQALVNTVIHRAAAGYGVTKKDLKASVHLITSDGRPTPWGAAGPGPSWMKLFLKRTEGQLAVRKTRILDSNRRAAGEREEIGAYFEAVKEVLAEHGIPSNRMFNCDETGW